MTWMAVFPVPSHDLSLYVPVSEFPLLIKDMRHIGLGPTLILTSFNLITSLKILCLKT